MANLGSQPVQVAGPGPPYLYLMIGGWNTILRIAKCSNLDGHQWSIRTLSLQITEIWRERDSGEFWSVFKSVHSPILLCAPPVRELHSFGAIGNFCCSAS